MKHLCEEKRLSGSQQGRVGGEEEAKGKSSKRKKLQLSRCSGKQWEMGEGKRLEVQDEGSSGLRCLKGNAEPWKMLEHGSEQIRAVLSRRWILLQCAEWVGVGETRGWEDNFESIAEVTGASVNF